MEVVLKTCRTIATTLTIRIVGKKTVVCRKERLKNLLLIHGSLEKVILLKKCVAVILWRLANGNCFRTTIKTLAIEKLTAVELTNKFSEVLSCYARFFIKFPVNTRDTAEAIIKFRESKKCIIPQAVGVTNATHVPILARVFC